MPDSHKGTCFCGAVEIEASGTPLEMGYCHCDSCRSYSGGPFSTYVLWPGPAVKVTRGEELLGRFNMSGMSDRQFCSACGGHLMTHHPGLGLTDVRPAVFRSLAFQPTVHLNYAETVLRMHDGLPKLRDFPAAAGGSGELVAD